MPSEQPNNPLHGVTLQALLEALVARHGWDGLAARVDVRCFTHEPSIASSLKFLRKTPWARAKVEQLYLEGERRRKRNLRRAARRAHAEEPMSLPRQPEWNHYTYTYGDGLPARVEFDVRAAVMPSDDPVDGVRLIADAPGDERALAALLDGVDCLLVGVLTYADRVEHVLHVADAEAVRAREPALRDAGVDVQYTPGRAYFEDRVSPSPADWRRIGDREALERLDLDGDGALRVLHRFLGDADALAAVRARLDPEGFELVSSDGDRMTLAHVHPIGDISRITLGLLRLCDPHGVAYDGWALPG